MAGISGNLKEPLTPQEKKFYGSIFKTLDPKNTGLISGKTAKPLLEASGLPLNLLGEIWNLSDPENNGVLNQFGFCVAMRLIAHTQQTGTIDINSIQRIAPLAKFGIISANNTGSGVLNNNLSNPINSRVSSVNSINSQSSNLNQQLLVPVLSKVQANSFGKMFDKVAINNLLPGDQAKDIFLKARLPIQILEKIWNLVDQSKTGQLSKPQFIVAMHLIQCFMNKSMTILPAILSDQLWNSASNLDSDNSNEHLIKSPLHSPTVPIPSPTKNPSDIPAQSPSEQKSLNNPQSSNLTNLNTWIMSNQQKQQYGSIFDNLDKSNSNQITSGEVANFLMTSKLPNDVLASIWELANLNDTNVFDKQEFSIAMYLVQKKLAGYDLPNETPTELIDSSSFGIALPQQSQQFAQSQGQFQQPPQLHQQQSFATASQTAPQRSASHMDDLLDIFQTNQIQSSPASQRNHVPPPAPAPRQSNTITGSFNPSSSFGRELQKQVEENESSDDDDGPENLDIPRTRNSAPSIPGRANKPHFDSNDALLNSNSKLTSTKYDALKNIDSLSPPEIQAQKSVAPGFSNQPVNVAFTNSVPISGFTNLASNVAPNAMSGFSVSKNTGNNNNNQADVSNQLTQASIDIANYSNQINSLTKQTSVISGKKDKSQQELNKILKTKESMQEKLIQMRTLHERESLQVQEVQNLMLKSKEESNNLQQELSLAEASYHAEQAKLSQLQNEYEESQKMNQSIKEKLGTLNAEVIDLTQQIEEFSSKAKQASNILAVSQQQYASQELENQNLLSKIEELKNSIYSINLKHSKLIESSEDLKEKNLELYQKHTELSVNHAEKNIAYSETLAKKASSGLGDISDDENNDEEVPTSSLDDFDDDEFNSAAAKADDAAVTTPTKKLTGTVPATPTNTNTDSNTITSKSLQAETPPTTQTTNDAYESNAPQQQFSLPFSIPHSETSSTQNNPSQSVRGDIDATDSPASTIEENVPLSSQILPEGADVGPSSSSSNENGESFEMVNHTDAENFTNNVTSENQSAAEVRKPLTAQTSDSVLPSETLSMNGSVDSSVVETLPDEPQNSQINSDFSPVTELQIDDSANARNEEDDDDSSDDEQFQDATFTDDLEPAQPEDPEAASKNPFSGETINARDAYSGNANTQSRGGLNMFDDLGLEEAPVEQAGDAFDNVNNGFSSAGFSFAHNNDAIDNSNVDSSNQPSSADGDDWEQLFAGFGNDPNLQPASIENEQSQPPTQHFDQPAVYGFSAEYDQNNSGGLNNEVQKDINKAKNEINSKYNQSQSMAIEELKGMGFEENEAVDALMQNNWNIDDASNYLLDAA